MITSAILDAVGHLGERKIIALPPRLRLFAHATIVQSPGRLSAKEDIPMRAFVGRCESLEGQLVCSCGMFALAWPDPAP